MEVHKEGMKAPYKVGQTEYVRVNQILEIIPISRATWWEWVRRGKAPRPIKIGNRTTCWKRSEVLALFERNEGGNV